MSMRYCVDEELHIPTLGYDDPNYNPDSGQEFIGPLVGNILTIFKEVG